MAKLEAKIPERMSPIPPHLFLEPSFFTKRISEPSVIISIYPYIFLF